MINNPKRNHSLAQQLGQAITSRKHVTSVALTAAYIILFFLYESSNFPITIFTILPVLTIAWLYGLRIGLAAASVSVLLNISLLLLVKGEIPTAFWRGGIPGHFVTAIAAAIVGRLHDVQKRLQQELTERKKAQEKVQQAERRYRELFEEAPAMYLITREQDHTPIITDCNDVFLQSLGYEAAKVIGRSLLDFYTPDSQSRLVEGGYQLALSGWFVSEERELVAKDGRIIPTLLRAVPERNLAGQLTGTRAMFVDITDLKQAEAALAEERALLATRVEERTVELRTANADLTRAVRAKDEFLATMSHELRTPLNAILGKTQVLQEGILGSLNEKQQHSLQVIEEGGRHLLLLISDILDVAKIGAGRLQLEIHTVDVAEICQSSLRLVQGMAHQKQITLKLTIDSNMTTLQVDGRRLKQVLVNLFSNGIKFTPEKGQVGLEVRGVQGCAHFTVWDTGIGISPEDINYLLREADKPMPFVQLDSSLSRQYEGSGLGLSLVYRLTEMHGGSVSIESQVGKGSRFTVSLPRQTGDQTQLAINADDKTSAGDPLPALPSSRAARILIVEDNQAGMEALSEFLRFHGFVVDIGTNGLEAIEQARRQSPDLVLMDVQMPVMDGLEATRRIRADKTLAAIPIIMLTALAMPHDRERCLATGADAYLSKPVRLTELLDMIEAQLSRKMVEINR